MLTPFGGEKLKIITYRYIIKTGTHKWKALVLTYTNMHCLLKKWINYICNTSYNKMNAIFKESSFLNSFCNSCQNLALKSTIVAKHFTS